MRSVVAVLALGVMVLFWVDYLRSLGRLSRFFREGKDTGRLVAYSLHRPDVFMPEGDVWRRRAIRSGLVALVCLLLSAVTGLS